LRNYGPKAQGYVGEASDRGLIAEAIRAYFADPNYLKSATKARVAPSAIAYDRCVFFEDQIAVPVTRPRVLWNTI
jgi:hypothetical protein